MRNIYFIISVLLSATIIGFLSPFFDLNFGSTSGKHSSYAVEIAKYKYPVYTDYFENLDDVIEINSKDGEYHYLAGVTQSKENAEEMATKIKKLGYDKARLVDLDKEFSNDELVDVLPQIPQTQVQKIKKKETVENAIAKLTHIGNAYFYSILLKASEQIEPAQNFLPIKPKALKQDGKFYYLLGKFEDVGSAEKYLKDKIVDAYSSAKVVVVNKGKLMNLSKEKPHKAMASGGNNMGRKMRGKEYVDYYYVLNQINFARTPSYYIQLGPYEDKGEAAKAVQKLHDLGFSNAGIKDPKKEKRAAIKPDAAAEAHYTIQIYAGRSAVKISRFALDGISQSYDQHDELYRYFFGDYDNYWVCRRDLREVRKKGFEDAFVVKL